MTNENLIITAEELLSLKQEHPLEIEIILEMLAEAGEDYSAEINQSEMMKKAA